MTLADKHVAFFSLSVAGLCGTVLRICEDLMPNDWSATIIADRSILDRFRKPPGAWIYPLAPTDPGVRITGWPEPHAIISQMKLLDDAYRRRPFRAVVSSELALGPLLWGRMRNVPVIRAGFQYFFYGSAESVGAPENYFAKAGHEALQAAARQLGLASAGRSWALPSLTGDFYLLQSLPVLSAEPLPPNVAHVGRCASRLSNDYKVDVPPATRNRVYVSLGRRFGGDVPVPTLLRRLAESGWRVLLHPRRLGADLTDQVARTPGISVGPFDVDDALERGCQMLCDGHSTDLLAALWWGRQAAVLPNGSGSDQAGAALQRRGLARLLDPRQPFESLMAELTAALRAPPSPESASARDALRSWPTGEKIRTALGAFLQ